jgi:hypothetical protein
VARGIPVICRSTLPLLSDDRAGQAARLDRETLDALRAACAPGTAAIAAQARRRPHQVTG